MAAVLMGWGPHRFEVGRAAFEELRRRVHARWEKHAIIGRRPAGQYLGPGEEIVSLRGTIYPVDQGGGVELLIAALLADCRAGATHILLSESGDIAGPHRLEAAQTVESFHLPDGTPQKLVYDLDFAVHDDGFGQIWSLWP
ncbi:phage tail protein [Methylosinus sp. Sm6]|uniref:phage tail protein n=1 Tax=Methylosinus sp. Sm6 TaxID=2866948 RepID=UPI001C99B619|nr:phage tail protein [Methylosinus sp. Sm6]MBY6242220.1 phage tail protein [Methylosinus sp. Sm6]